MTRALNRPAGRRLTRRAGLVPAAVAGAVLALTGCQATSPMTTELQYDAADGISVRAGDVVLSDLVVLSTKEGAKGRLSGAALNNGDKPVTVTITPQDGTDVLSRFTLEPGRSSLADSPIAVSRTAAPGALMPASISVGGDAALRNLPVLLPDHAYSELAPESYTAEPRASREGAEKGADEGHGEGH